MVYLVNGPARWALKGSRLVEESAAAAAFGLAAGEALQVVLQTNTHTGRERVRETNTACTPSSQNVK